MTDGNRTDWEGMNRRMKPIRVPGLLDGGDGQYFSRFGKDRCPEDAGELREFLGRLDRLREVVYDETHRHMAAFNAIVRGLNRKCDEQDAPGWWGLDTDTLTANEALYLVCYPFFDRWGGSWEARFALRGDLGRYLTLYGEKLMHETGEEDGFPGDGGSGAEDAL